MTMLQTKFVDNYLAYGSNVSVFMSALLLPMTRGYSNISKINNCRTSMHVFTFLNYY